MANTKSYRFSEETTIYLERLKEITQCSERQIIESAIENIFHDCEYMDKDIVIDFHDNIYGINSSRIQTFIESLPECGYEISYYGDGDRLVIHEIE